MKTNSGPSLSLCNISNNGMWTRKKANLCSGFCTEPWEYLCFSAFPQLSESPLSNRWDRSPQKYL